MIFDNAKKNLRDFAKLLVQLDAAEVIGLARMLSVELFYADIKDEKGLPTPRSGEAIIEDCLVKFNALNRQQRKDILRLMRAAVKEK